MDLSFVELRDRFALNLTRQDLRSAKLFGLYIDIQNIRSLLLEEAIDNRGNLTEKELDEALLGRFGLPEYVFDFLDQYENMIDRVTNFSKLLARFFVEEKERHRGFLQRYLAFEREWRLVLVGLRAKALGRDLVRELQFEDPTDPMVAHLLAQKDISFYEPPPEYRELRALFLELQPTPQKQYRSFTQWRLQQMEELVDTPLFSLDWILAYAAQLLIVEDFNRLQEEQGSRVLETFKVG